MTALAPSPVQVFREMLVMTSETRADRLNLYPPGLREPIEAKVKEYLALAPEERELRLQATELRHYLQLLLPLHETNRAGLIPQIAGPMRALVVERVDLWNMMPPPMQEQFLENEQVKSYFAQLGGMSPKKRKEMLDAMPAAEREQLKANIARWLALPAQMRTNAFAQLDQFFGLTGAERTRAMSKLSDTEREAMTQTLEAFAGLTPEQRRTCIRSFEKFANMGLAERQQFLKKAEAWQRMTPSEREQWREVVALVPQLPPFPVGMVPRVGPTPPSSLPKTNPAMPVRATNGG